MGISLEYGKYLEFIGIDPAKLGGLSRKKRKALIKERHLDMKEQLTLRKDISEMGIKVLDFQRYSKELAVIAGEQKALNNWERKFPLQKAA